MPKILHSLLPKSLHFWLPFTVVTRDHVSGRGPTRSVGRGRSEAERNGVLRNIHYDPKRKYNRKGGQSVGLVNHLFVVCYFLFP